MRGEPAALSFVLSHPLAGFSLEKTCERMGTLYLYKKRSPFLLGLRDPDQQHIVTDQFERHVLNQFDLLAGPQILGLLRAVQA